MKNPMPVILIKCGKQIRNYIRDCFISFNDALIIYIDSAAEIDKLANTLKIALLIVEINANNKTPFKVIKNYKKKTYNQNGPILYLTQKSFENLYFKSDTTPGYFDILQFPFSKAIFINKIGLFLHLLMLQEKTGFAKKNVKKRTTTEEGKNISERTEQLTKEVAHHLRTKLTLQDKVQKIDESKYFLEMLIESIPIPLFIKNNLGEYVKCNKAFENFIENPRENFLGKTFYELALNEFADKVHRSDIKIMQTGKSKISEEIYRKLDGSLINTIVHINVFLNKRNNTKGLIGIIVDITKIKRAEKLLKIQSTIDYLISLNKGIVFTLKNIINHIMELEWVDSGGIYLYNKKKEELKLVYSSGISKAFAKSVEVYNKNSPQMKMVLRKKPIYGNYLEMAKKNKTQILKENLHFTAIIPLINTESEELIGCLNLASRKYDKITEQDKSDMESIAHSLVSLILYAQSQEKLKELNAQLEDKIKERTISLRETNEKLSNEIKYHRETKEALIYSENLYRSIFENAQEGIALYDARSFQLVDINQKAHQDLGYSREEFFDLKPENYIVYDYSEQSKDILKKIRSNKKVRNEIKLRSKNGYLNHCIISTSLVNINNRKFILGIFHNITQLKQTEAKLKDANKQIVKINKNLEKRIEKAVREQKLNQQYLIQKSKLESLGELAAGIAHEINQPLGVLALSHENLQMKIASKLATPDYLRNKFNSIEDNIGKIRQIIDHIRTFSRDQDLLAMEKVNLNKVVNKALSLISTQYRNHNIHIKLYLNEEVGFTVGSNIQVEQVILNLLSNAKYAVDEKATYMNEMEYTKEIIIRTATSDKKVSLVIEDNGTGIDVKDLPKIFDPFYTTKPEGFGTGLGLSIAYGIIRSMRGDIQTDSKKDIYTRVEILFPKFPENN